MQAPEYEYEEVKPSYAELGDNPYLTETAGYVPLEVRFKQFEQAGIMNKFHTSEFTSSDYRDMYLNPDFQISPEDDLEDAEEKLRVQRQFIEELKLKKAKSNGINEPPTAAKAGTVEPEKEPEKAEN